MIEVYKPGDTIEIPFGKVYIKQVCVSAGGKVLYEVAWWTNGDYKKIWLDAEEIPVQSKAQEKIGFKTGECQR